MAIYRGNVRRNFLKTQQKLRRQYEEAGMTEEQINALYEYDLCQMNRDISFAMHTIPLQSVVENSESSDTSYNRKLAEAFPFHNDKGANIKNMGRLIDSRAILW